MVSTPAAAAGRADAQRGPRDGQEPLTVGLWLIVGLKGLTALLLWAAFVVLLIAHRDDPRDFVSVMVFRAFHGNPPAPAIDFLVRNMHFISGAMVIRLAVVTAAYGLVESIEAVGLLLRKWWAEWLVILVTVSFIPFEIYELAFRPNAFRIGALIANLIVLWYLLKRMFDKRAEQRRAILRRS